MTKKKILFIAAPFILIFALTILIGYSYLFAGCGIDQNYAKTRVLEHLSLKGFNPQFLKYDEARSDKCKISFIYKNDKQNIHFMVIDGGKVKWWDYNERGE